MAANQLRSPSLILGFWANQVSNVSTRALSAAGTWLAFGFTVDQNKTLNTVRAFLNTLTGTPSAAECTCDLYSDSNGIPNASLESRPADSVPASNNWMGWSGFTTALTAGTQYWLVFKNGNASPGTNFPTYQFIGSPGTGLVSMPLGAGGNFNAQGVMYGWNCVATVNSGTAWATSVTSSIAGFRVGFSDSTYDGSPVQTVTRPTNGGTGDRAFGKSEVGVKFTVPANATLNVRGVWFPLCKFGSPGSLRFRIYQGTTLLATSNAIAAGNVATAAGEGYTGYFSSAVALSNANSPYRIVFGDATAGDTNANGYNGELYTFDADSNSTSLRPLNGTASKTITSDNTATPPVFTDTAADMLPFALLLDTSGEFAAAAGGGLLLNPGLAGGMRG